MSVDTTVPVTKVCRHKGACNKSILRLGCRGSKIDL
jgi:hypothetical protein